jgi:hypothetical protein
MNEMTTLLVLHQYFLFHLLGLLFIIKGHLHKTKATTTKRDFISHDNLILNLSELREILEKIGLYINLIIEKDVITLSLERKASDEKFYLVLCSWSME